MKELFFIRVIFIFYYNFRDLFSQIKTSDKALGTRKYDDFQKPAFCGTSCHTDFYRQWQQAMRSQAYTHGTRLSILN